MNPEYDSVPACPAVQLLCKHFVEKVQQLQGEIGKAAIETEPHRAQAGFMLNIEKGEWVKPKSTETTASALPPMSPQ